MKSNKNLVLLGMMGSGKSTIGKLLAKKLNLQFVDVDFIIEDEAKMKISDIFKKKGEIFFRSLEEKITLKILNSSSKVIALGGGSFLNNKIRKEVIEKNFSFWLNWKNSTLINRIKKNNKRPIAYNSTETELKNIMSQRFKIYNKAQFKINCNKLTKTEIVSEILKKYANN